MTVFISWSGSKSKTVANALRTWLKDVIQSVDPWVSDVDLEAGVRWNNEVSHRLEQSKFGIICLTKENQQKPWIMFEAGALAKTIENTHVVPYLIDMEPHEIAQGPLTQFQAKRADESGTRDMLRAINETLTEGRLPQEDLKRYFTHWWPDLKNSLDALPLDSQTTAVNRPLPDMMEEMLVLVRGLSQRPYGRDGEADEILEILLEADPRNMRTLHKLVLTMEMSETGRMLDKWLRRYKERRLRLRPLASMIKSTPEEEIEDRVERIRSSLTTEEIDRIDREI